MNDFLQNRISFGDLAKVGGVIVVLVGMYLRIGWLENQRQEDMADLEAAIAAEMDARMREDERIENRMENRTGRNTQALQPLSDLQTEMAVLRCELQSRC